jgi:hypothetical protein
VHAGPWRYLSLIVFHDKRRSIGNVERTKSVYRITIGRHWRRPRSGWLTLAGPSGCPTAKCIFVASAARQSVLQSMTSIGCAPRSKSSSSHAFTCTLNSGHGTLRLAVPDR